MKRAAVLGFLTVGASAGLFLALASMPKAAVAAALGPKPIYDAQCNVCHGDQLDGGQFGPSLKNADFANKWRGKSGELLAFIKTSMPPATPGQLSEADYAALHAMIVDASGVDGPPGAARAPERPGWVGPKPAPELFRDATFERALAAQKTTLAAITPVTAEMLRQPPAGDRLTWRRGQNLTGFSPLDQINRDTVVGLKVKWSWTMKPGPNELAPLVHDGVMFIQSGDEVNALDAATGTLLWKYVRPLPAKFRSPLTAVQRSIAIYGTMLYVAMPDRFVVALDLKTGNVAWETEIVPADYPLVSISSGPFLAGGTVVQSTSVGPFCRGGCWVTGLDAATGKKLWRFNNVATTGKDGDTWNGLAPNDRTGGATWVGGSYDPDLDLLYFGTAGTYDVTSLVQPDARGKIGRNDALYTNATIALRPSTGQLVWYHQHMPRELWDLDEVFERMLVTLPVGGRDRNVVISTGKLGIMDALDREDGKYLFSYDFGLNNLITAIDPRTGARTVDPRVIPQLDKPVELCPSVDGVRNWMAPSFNAATNILYMPIYDVCMDFVRSAGDVADGKVDMGWRYKPRPGSDGLYGGIRAVDLVSRKTLWEVKSRPLPASSLIATAGGVLFTGDTNRYFSAIDDRTGKLLWQARLNATPSATPLTFSAAGQQYVAVTTGGGGAHDVVTPPMTPEESSPAPTTTIWVFGL